MPAWVTDHDIWEKAKAAAAKSGKKKKGKDKYALVTHIYEKMGGRINGEVRKSLGSEIVDLLKAGKARYQEGQKWQQKSGRWVMKVGGKIVPVKKGRKKKPDAQDEIIHRHAAETAEEHEKNLKKVKDEKTPEKAKSKIKRVTKPKKGVQSYQQQVKEHQATKQSSDTGQGAGREETGGSESGAGASSGEVSSGVYRARGKEILVARPELSQKPKQNHLDKSIAGALDAHQADGVNLGIENFDSGEKGYFNADGTGAGKTRQIIALAGHYAPKTSDPVLVVTKNANIIRQNFTDDAKAMGLKINPVSHPDEMKVGHINICTYAALSKMARRVSVADEKLGELAKEAWKYKTPQEFAEACNAGTLTPNEAYAIFSHTGYAKVMQKAYKENPEGVVQKAFEDFWKVSHGKDRKLNFQWSAQGLRNQKAMGNQVSNVNVSDAKKTGMVLFDEAHELKNIDSGQSENGLAMMDHSDRVGLFTATPMDKPEHVHYLCNAYGYDYNKVLQYCGYSTDTKGNVKSTNMPLEARMNAIGNIFMNLTHEGKMIKREVSLKNMALKAHMVPMEEEDKRKYNEAQAFFEQKIAEAGGGPGAMNVAGQATLALRRLNESFKIKHIVNEAIGDLKAGRQAVLFLDNVGEKGKQFKLHKESKVEFGSSVEAAMGHFQEMLKAHPELSHVKVVEYHGKLTPGQRRQAQRDFQAGKAHVFITTPKSGGTGINLDDVVGNAPRAVHMATAPYSANEFIQELGRTNRLTTKSKTYINMHMTDTPSDDKNVGTMIDKVKTLGAAVSGDYESLRVPDKSVATLPGMQGADEIGDIWDHPQRPFIRVDMKHFKKDMQKSLSDFLMETVAFYKGQRLMIKALIQVGPQGGHFYTSKTGNRVYVSDFGRNFHSEISQANHPDLVTNAILKMDIANRKGSLPEEDMKTLMGHAEDRMRALMGAKVKHEEKQRAARAQVVTHKRRTTEDARRARKAKVDKKLRRRIENAKTRMGLYKEKIEKLKLAHGHYEKLKAGHDAALAELAPRFNELKAKAEKLKGYKETMPETHPQYPNLVNALQKHSADVKEFLPKYQAAKQAAADSGAKIERIRELHKRAHGIMRDYARAAKEDIDTMRKSLLADADEH